MKPSTIFRGVIPLVAALTGVASAAIHMDGSLPVYPNGVTRGFNWSTPNIDEALRSGFDIFEDTTDSVNTVARWYQNNLPKGCAKSTNGVAVAFRCSEDHGVSIRTMHGKTMIVISPETKVPVRR